MDKDIMNYDDIGDVFLLVKDLKEGTQTLNISFMGKPAGTLIV